MFLWYIPLKLFIILVIIHQNYYGSITEILPYEHNFASASL